MLRPPQLDAADTSSATRLRLARWIPSVEHSTAPPIVPGTNGPVGRAPILTRSSSQGSFSRVQWAARCISAVSSAASPWRLLWQHSLPASANSGLAMGALRAAAAGGASVLFRIASGHATCTWVAERQIAGDLQAERASDLSQDSGLGCFLCGISRARRIRANRLPVAARETSRVPEPPMATRPRCRTSA